MRKLARLLNPRTVAVIGGKECERVIEQCDKLGFDGTIWPVHPTRDELRGRPCFRTVEDLPAAPDAAFVAVNRESSIDVVEALAKSGTGGAVCYAAGFAEANAESDGAGELQNRLVHAAADMPIIGPNCYGFVNALERVALWPDQHGATACDRGVAILTQSSNVAINLTMQRRGLPVAYVMTVGNQAQLGLSTLAMAMLEDERITALGVHVEGLDDVNAFEELARRARALNKPIVAMKVGKSEQAQAATLTHTASLAGSDIAHDALFKRLGVARVHTLEAFLETLKLLHVHGPLPGNELLSMSCSGGEASLMADAAEGRSVQFRPYTTAESVALKEILGNLVAVANPLDYNTFIWGDWPGMIRMFEAALAPGFDLALLVMDFPRDDLCDADDWDRATDAFVAAVKQTDARAAVVASITECMPERVATHLMQVGIVPICGLDNAIFAAEAAATVGKVWAEPLPEPFLVIRPPDKADSNQQLALNEYLAKEELAAAGLIVPKGHVVSDPCEIPAAIAKMKPPFALKALGIAHKTEAGAVALGFSNEPELAAAMEEMNDLSNQFLIEEMVPKPVAELIVGVTRDPAVGLVLTIGAGGVLTELLTDTSTLLLPVDKHSILQALASLKISRLLDGYRDQRGADVHAVADAILSIATYATRNAETLEELDVNPLFATADGAIAVDALIVKREVR